MKKLLLSVAALCFSAAAFCAPVEQKKDTAVYTIGDGSLYGFENVWIQSRSYSNFPTEGSYEVAAASRGMTVVGDDVATAKVLIVKRTAEAKIVPATATTPVIKKDNKLEILVFNGLTGDQEQTIELPDSMFCYLEKDTLWQTGFPINDIHVDNAGNVILANMVLNIYNKYNSGRLMVYACDLDFTNHTVATAKKVVDYMEYSEEAPATYRIDYIGVYGDLLTNGYVLGAISGAYADIVKLTIENGANPDFMETITAKEFVPAAATQLSTGPRAFPLDETNFYLDGQDSFAGLYDMDGNYVDGFKEPEGGYSEAMSAYVKNMTTGNNGVCEFNLSGKTFMVHSYRNTTGTPASSFGIIKLDLEGGGSPEPMVVFPTVGMGTESNGVRTALPRVIIDQPNNTAHIWAYQQNNGLAYYKFTAVETGTKNVLAGSDVKVNNVIGNRINMTEEVASLEVFSVLGQRVAGATNVSSIEVPANGIFVVKAIDMKGASMTEKVILK
jgi:hypothetical protein